MVRRSFRFGLRLGLLLALLAALIKVVRSRRSSVDGWAPPPMPSWPPIHEGAVAPEAPQPAVQAVREAATVVTRSAPPEPTASEPEPAPASAQPLWVEPEGDACPASHPVKGKLSSGLFHLPGMNAYDRTRPDRCYADEAAATEDGLRRAKR
jgi:hypothetical protein